MLTGANSYSSNHIPEVKRNHNQNMFIVVQYNLTKTRMLNLYGYL